MSGNDSKARNESAYPLVFLKYEVGDEACYAFSA